MPVVGWQDGTYILGQVNPIGKLYIISTYK
jgi:hypothetical protein